MKVKFLCYSFVLFFLIPGLAFAGNVMQEDFKVDTTEQLINLCTAAPDDPFFNQAMNFCHGYAQGAYDYYEAAHGGAKGPKMVCFSEPPPSRNEAINMFISWAKANPQYNQKLPVNTLFRFLTQKWPCN